MTDVFNEQPEKVVKIISKRTILLGAFLILSALIQGEIVGALGIIFGLLISLLLFRLKLVNSRRALKMDRTGAEKFIRNRTLINLAIYFVVLAVAMRNLGLSFFGVVLGLLLLKFTIIGSAVARILKDYLQNKKLSYQQYSSESCLQNPEDDFSCDKAYDNRADKIERI